MVWLEALPERLRLSLWFVPGMLAICAGVLAFALVAVDQRLSGDPDWLVFAFGGTAEGARAVLSVIATSMLTFTGLVFSITMLVLQLASSQLSPRVTRTFLRDRGNQVVLGIFVATFVYTLVVLHEVRAPTEAGEGFVPSLSIWVAFALLFGSIGAFIWYIDHMAHAIRASTVITAIWRETVSAIERLFPERIGTDAPTGVEQVPDRSASGRLLGSHEAGVVMGIDDDGLEAVASHGDRVLELLPAIGDFVPEGAPLARLWGEWDEAALDDVRGAVGLGGERTLEQDAAFGLRQLVDIALRALSPGINDPSTAVQALDRIHDLLRRLAVRRFPTSARAVDGVVRLRLNRPGWDDLLRLALEEIRLAGAHQVQIDRRLRVLLDDLMSIAPDGRLPALRRELERLGAGHNHPETALVDRQGPPP
ncbi:DUF2254 domain-containing protein [soil metagenome]